MGPFSDLDPYVVDFSTEVNEEERSARTLQVKEALKGAVAHAQLPELDADGSYAELVSADSLFLNFGSPEDDGTGAFTKRVLLVLESKALVNTELYDSLITRAINIYWKNEDEHPRDYLPLVLVNDIVRYWRTLLLNHESRLERQRRKRKLTSEGELAWRRYRSYKLRVPLCLTCFSTLTYLLALARDEGAHISKEEAGAMIALTPIERLRATKNRFQSTSDPYDLITQLEDLYGGYLSQTSRSTGKDLLLALESDTALQQEISTSGARFTRLTFELVQTLGAGSMLHRYIVV